MPNEQPFQAFDTDFPPPKNALDFYRRLLRMQDELRVLSAHAMMLSNREMEKARAEVEANAKPKTKDRPDEVQP